MKAAESLHSKIAGRTQPKVTTDQLLLQRALGRERLVVGIVAAALVLTVGLFMVVGKSFMPLLKEGNLIMQAGKFPSVNLADRRHWSWRSYAVFSPKYLK
jgi:Cu/Ag efflux pump CusA